MPAGRSNPLGAGPRGGLLIAQFPIDDISERLAIEIGAQIGAEDIYGTMPILVSGAGDMRRDQHPRIGPEPHHGCVLAAAVTERYGDQI